MSYAMVSFRSPPRVYRNESNFTEVPSDHSSNENAEENYTCIDTRNL